MTAPRPTSRPPSVPVDGPEEAERLLAPRFRPAGTRLGLLTTVEVDGPLLAALDAVVVGAGLAPARRLARLQPRVGEVEVRAADVADFLRRYGHEYVVAVFRSDRWSPAEQDLVDRAGAAEGCTVLWAARSPTAGAPARAVPR